MPPLEVGRLRQHGSWRRLAASAIGLAATVSAIAAGAVDQWVAVDRATPGVAEAPVANLSRIEINGNGNRVVPITVRLISGYRMDMLSEVDCEARRTRSLASSTVDKSGQLVSASGASQQWLPESRSPSLNVICGAAVPASVR